MKRLVVLFVVMMGGTALAYPQFQLGKDQTCSSCHLSPSGGGLLNENGRSVANSISKFSSNPDVLDGLITPPDWLDLGGDFRGNAGYIQAPFKTLDMFPMQADLEASAHFSGFRAYATVGFRPTQDGNETATAVWSREHWLMWQNQENSPYGLFVRIGRMMPVLGLRLAEHPDYIRRYGGTALYTETYGAQVAYIDKRYEVHASGFLADPLIDTVDTARGGALYGEYRLTEHASVGAEGMIQSTDDDRRYRGGLTGKLFIPGPDVQLQAEVQMVGDKVLAGGFTKQIVGYALASTEIGSGLQLDVGLGHYDEDLAVKNLDRDCVDVNLHWYATSHIELVWNNRYEMLGFGNGGPAGAYSLIQLHYRL